MPDVMALCQHLDPLRSAHANPPLDRLCTFNGAELVLAAVSTLQENTFELQPLVSRGISITHLLSSPCTAARTWKVARGGGLQV